MNNYVLEYFQLFEQNVNEKFILVDVRKLTLSVMLGFDIVKEYNISCGKKGYGVGVEEGTNKTPLGMHIITQKIGGICQDDIFIGREKVGKFLAEHNLFVYDNGKKEEVLEENGIIGGILRICGMEFGNNFDFKKTTTIDSFRRYIYIHGIAHDDKIDKKCNITQGCIGLKRADVVDLMKHVDIGVKVLIFDDIFLMLCNLKKDISSKRVRIISQKENVILK